VSDPGLPKRTRRSVLATLVGAALPPALSVGAAAQPAAPEQPNVSEVPMPPRRPSPPGAKADHHKAAWLSLPPTPGLPSTLRHGLADLNGIPIFFAQFGEGPPVLLLHGGLAHSNYWGHQIEALAASFAVTVMDTRGHGRSPVASGVFSYAAFAEDAAALMDHLNIPAAAVIGWSDGAITGLQLAMTRPERVSRLFAFGANSSLDGLIPGGAKNPVFAAFGSRCRTEYAALSPHPERWARLTEGLRHMWRTEPNMTAPMLGRVKAPTTISDGEHDEIIRREHTARMAAAIPGARLVMQPGVSHFAMLQDPAQFNAAVLDFLNDRG
jgi:pimeloyl-ACP methyl ester carboxylesterase